MRIEKASEMGYCYGVRRAIDIVEKAAGEDGEIQTLGPLVHNQQVVDRLAGIGVIPAPSLDQVQTKVVAITSHGVSPEMVRKAEAQGLKVIDTTCPFVRKAQASAQGLAEAGFWVHVFGDRGHPEVEGLLGWAGERASASKELPKLDPWPKRLGVVCQTTQSVEALARFVSELGVARLADMNELRVVNTICDATRRNQRAALDLSARVDAMIVVGGHDSANTKRLAELCAATGTPTYHIATPQEIDASWVDGLSSVGVTAGASTPDHAVEEVIAALSEMAGNS